MKKIFLLFLLFAQNLYSQTSINLNRLNWLPKSHQFWLVEQGNLNKYDASNLGSKSTFLSAEQLKASGFQGNVENIVWSEKQDKILIFTNSMRVWRANTKGDYWLFDLKTGKGQPIGKGLAASSLMFAKISPDSKNIGFVSNHNI